MVSVVVAILIAGLCLLTRGWPIVLPVFGLVLGINGILKNKKSPKLVVKWLGIVSMVLNGIVTLSLVLRIYQ